MRPLRLFINQALGRAPAKPVWFGLSLLPAAWLIFAAFADRLGANPAEALIRSTGDWALRALCLVLLITPLRNVAGLPSLARFRRMAGLFVYFYGVAHLLTYAWLDRDFDIVDISNDIADRPFILVGFAALVALTLLAATSFNRAIRWLGGARWQRLHQLVHAVAVLAVLHFFWIRAGKHNFFEVSVYALILGSLLLWRLSKWAAKRVKPSAAVSALRRPPPESS